MITIPQFKIRCSAIGEIMGGAFNRPTAKQLEELAMLEAKPTRTAIQEAKLADLIAKRDNPPALQDGAKTYCQLWLKEQLYQKRKEFSNKYTEKGNSCEPDGIKLVAEYMGYGEIFKNEKYYENDFMTGTPDLVLADIIEEVKNSWSAWTFPLFATEIPDKDYPLQVQGYMELAGKKKAGVNYCLIDAPLELMDSEARRQWYKMGNSGDVDMELYDEVYAKMTYPNLPNALKLKRWEFQHDKSIIDAIERQVGLCREYIKTIMPSEEVLAQIAAIGEPMQLEHTFDIQAMKEANG